VGVRVLTLSDVETPAVYSSRIRSRFGETDLVISCGDLPSYYLEYVISMLNLRLYYVNGNHVQRPESEDNAERDQHPWGAINLHRKVVYDTQGEMWRMVLGLAPQLASNRVKYGRYLDVFVSHASAAGIQDDTDKAHQGVEAFRWLLATFKPRYHLHGHMHHYNPLKPNLTQFGNTQVVNTYGYREIEI
jgi:hypothetical protein